MIASQAVEKLDASLASPLFAPDAHIFEQGGDETWPIYLKDHLGPEFAEFSSFAYADYQSSATIEGNLAIASETYRYTLVVKASGEKVERLGTATSVSSARKVAGRSSSTIPLRASRLRSGGG